jgi:hypothetical protein
MPRPFQTDRHHPLSSAYELIELPRIWDPRGSLTFIEGERHVEFDVACVSFTSITCRSRPTGHAHHKLSQLIIAVSGGFNVNLDNGREKSIVRLDRPYRGLLLRPMVWRSIDNISGDAICLVVASICYDEADYIRDYHDFLRLCRARK